ncbi:MAG TPA: ATP synthase F1 subunit gamma [Phaeodactylibacter sp.]|nr:ATP synthase F1 subunit gamma [Phaeodactylibacter sp.]
MANLKEVRERIASVKNTRQITSAMKMVSAAKLRKAQSAIQDMRPYANKMDEMLRNILSNLDGSVDLSYGKERKVTDRACLVVVTSSRGLCGAFNSNIIKAAVRCIDEQYPGFRAEGKLSILCIGKKGYDFFKKRYADCEIIDDYVDLFNDLRFDQVAPIADRLMQAFEDGTYDHISVVYAHFRNAAMQYPMTETFLPVPKIELDEEEDAGKKRADYIFEPDQEQLLEHLIPSILRMNFHKYMLDTHASEHGARMTAMDKASENADELLRELRISYNKARQEAITKELSEIVGGAAALEG